MISNWQVPIASIGMNDTGKWVTYILGCVREHESLEKAREAVMAAGYKVKLKGVGPSTVENWIA